MLTLATVELAFPHHSAVRSDVGCPGAVVVGKSTATVAVLEQLVADRLLPVNINSERPV